jgi:hypothetical protein
VSRVIPIGRAAAALALLLVVGVQPVAAQAIDPDGCATMKEQTRYLTNEGTFIQEAGLKNGVDLLAEAIEVRNVTCGTPGDQSVPTPDPVAPTPVPVATPPPVTPTPAPTPDDKSAFPSPAACMLITEGEVGAAMKQAVTASADDPLGDPAPDIQGCDFNGAGAAFTTIIYFQANAEFIYAGLRSTAEANGIDSLAGLGDRAFTYVGANGPGVVVAKGDKVFALEFNGIGNGSTEQSSLLALAHQAVNRVSAS